jgi:4-diphosphocytidyl-2-C-methyl-D-erythritol kinase
LRGQRVLIFKPAFGVSTPWAYAQLAARAPRSYLPAAEAESRLAAWMRDERAPMESLLFNNMESAAFGKFVALPALVRRLRERFQITAHMSGSGSACFALLSNATPAEAIVQEIRAAWGDSACVIETRLT